MHGRVHRMVAWPSSTTPRLLLHDRWRRRLSAVARSRPVETRIPISDRSARIRVESQGARIRVCKQRGGVRVVPRPNLLPVREGNWFDSRRIRPTCHDVWDGGLARMNISQRLERGLGWIDRHSLPNAGIAVHSKSRQPYPEVTGYLIPSLLKWDETERATAF